MRVTDLLRTMDIFENLAPEELERIARLLRERRLDEGEVLVRKGDAGDAMFIVTGGKVRLSTTDPSGNEKVLTYFTDGQFFGEMSLLTGAPRSASATAETECRVMALQKDDFDALLGSNPGIMREMLKVISTRTVQTNQQLLQDDSAGSVAAGSGKVFAIFSPRGGAGKSTLAVNLAAALARELPERAALLDLDLTFGHDALLLNLAPQTSLAAVPPETLADFDRRTLGQYTLQHPSSLQILVGAIKPEEGEAVTGEHVRAALSAMRRQYIATVIDCAPTFSDPVLAALETADKVIVVCTPELTTLRDLRECQRIFGDPLHLPKEKLLYVLNYYQPFKVLTLAQFESSLEQAMELEIPHAGEAAMKASMKGEPLVLSAAGSPFGKAIEKLVDMLIPADLRPARSKTPRQAVAATASNGAAHVRPRTLLGMFRRA